MGGQNAPQAKPEGSGQSVDTHVDTVAATPALDEAARQQGEARLRELEAQKKAAREAGNEEAAQTAEAAEAQLRQDLAGTVAQEASSSSPDKKGEGTKNFIEQFLEGLKALFAQIAVALGLTTGEKKEDEKDKDKKGKKGGVKQGPRSLEAQDYKYETVEDPEIPLANTWDAVYASPADPERASKIDSIVIHTCGAGPKYLVNPPDAKTNPKRRVSSHFYIGEDGQIYQLCSLNRTAWHADAINPRSIGIDFEHADTGKGAEEDPYTDAQYTAAAKLFAYLMDTYNIPLENIIGHQELTANRSDPGDQFEWDTVRAMTTAELERRKSKKLLS